MPSRLASDLDDKIAIIIRSVLMGNHSSAMRMLNGLPKKKAMFASAIAILAVGEQNSASANTFLRNLEKQAT